MIYIVTGPESSGKTTLSKQLAKKLKYPLSEEHARLYLTEITSKSIKQKELLKILLAQEAYCKELQLLNKEVICDTDAFVIKLWNDAKFGKPYPQIENILKKYNFTQRKYFVCYPDLPWEDDPMREHPSLEDRLRLYYKQIDLLKFYNASYHIIKGDNRLDQALKVIG